jgi:signal transduction histidine kinase
MANKWSVNAPVDVNSYQEWGAQSVSQNLEKAIRNEQLKRNIGNIKYQNIQQIDLPNTQQSLIAGEFRPIWMDGELFLVRKLLGNNSNTAQGVWLHKDVLKEKLLSLAKDLFADANLIPVAQNISAIEGAIDSSLPPLPEKMVDDALALVTLPWRLSVIESRASYVPSTSAAITAMRFAWIGMGIAFAAGTALVMGLVRMSERRATFVSSVTHELRTPLTTFQLYSDLLASGMVKEEEKKNLYYETLRREADRLGHLVENVLAFAKVERGSARGGKKLCQWNDFLPSILERMQQRLHQANLQLETDFADQIMEQKIHTDPVALEHILFNLADNSAKYAHPHSSAKVILTITQNSKSWTITLRDFGPGIEKSERHHIFRAFQKSKNANDSCKSGVGLGLSLSRRLAKSINATLTYDASNPQGATFILKSPI